MRTGEVGRLIGALLTLVFLGLAAAWPAAAAGAGAQDPAYLGFFPKPVKQGTLPLLLYPNAQSTGKVLVVGVGVPFPPGYLSDPRNLALYDSLGQEMPIHVKVLARWPEPVPGAGSLRAVLIQFRDLLGTTVARKYELRWGAPRTLDESMGWDPKRDWVPSKDSLYPAGSVEEPPVLAVLPPEWLDRCLLKGRMLPPNHRSRLDYYDKAMEYYYQGSLNRLDPKSDFKHRVEPLNDREPWLYDRAMTFFTTYMRLGGIEPLRQGHEATQYYAKRVDEHGRFSLIKKDEPDVKYAYQECLAVDYWFTGDPEMLAASRRSLQALATWEPEYTADKTFWTERHLAFQLLGYTTAYELLGIPDLLNKAKASFEAGYRLQLDPPAPAPRGLGCMIHRAKAHSVPIDAWVCSPWMSALFVDASLRYYLMTADARVPKSVFLLADFLVSKGVHRQQMHPSRPDRYTFPYYLINPADAQIKTEVDPYSAMHHALDTAKILAVAIYFSQKMGINRPQYQQVYDELMKLAHRVWGEVFNRKKGQTLPWRPAWPARKFNWWFRTTTDMDWLVSQPAAPR